MNVLMRNRLWAPEIWADVPKFKGYVSQHSVLKSQLWAYLLVNKHIGIQRVLQGRVAC